MVEQKCEWFFKIFNLLNQLIHSATLEWHKKLKKLKIPQRRCKYKGKLVQLIWISIIRLVETNEISFSFFGAVEMQQIEFMFSESVTAESSYFFITFQANSTKHGCERKTSFKLVHSVKIFLKNGPIPASFLFIFVLFLVTISIQIEKSVEGVLGIRTRGW